LINGIEEQYYLLEAHVPGSFTKGPAGEPMVTFSEVVNLKITQAISDAGNLD
jgi:hypothetical protein